MQDRRPKTSPWGPVQDATRIAPGLWAVSTAGHGGIYVNRDLLARIPAAARETAYSKGGWFEEDCDWAIPFVAFEAEILAGGEEYACLAITKGEHRRTLAQWHGSLVPLFPAGSGAAR